MGDSKFGNYGGFWTLLLAGFVIVALIFCECALITMAVKYKITHYYILFITLIVLLGWFLYIFAMATKYWRYVGNNYTRNKKNYKKNDEYMVSLWITMRVTVVCSIGYSVAEAYL